MADSAIPSHFAVADESRYNRERFRAVAMLSCTIDNASTLRQLVSRMLVSSELSEFKWHKLRQGRDRFAALGILDITMEWALRGQLRMDVLIWDARDSRHTVARRDDIANLQRMYYHLFKNVLRNRWPPESIWELHPDEHTAMNWDSVADYLDITSTTPRVVKPNLFSADNRFRLRVAKDFHILKIEQVCSHKEPLCQVADLFAGLSAFSYSHFPNYLRWLNSTVPQIQIDFASSPAFHLSNSDRERFQVLRHFSEQCKVHKMGVGLRSSGGLTTYDPAHPLNFWLYKPQSLEDKAPTKVAEAGA